jgi:hypothetical protein
MTTVHLLFRCWNFVAKGPWCLHFQDVYIIFSGASSVDSSTQLSTRRPSEPTRAGPPAMTGSTSGDAPSRVFDHVCHHRHKPTPIDVVPQLQLSANVWASTLAGFIVVSNLTQRFFAESRTSCSWLAETPADAHPLPWEFRLMNQRDPLSTSLPLPEATRLSSFRRNGPRLPNT